jgi:hypothetical protein
MADLSEVPENLLKSPPAGIPALGDFAIESEGRYRHLFELLSEISKSHDILDLTRLVRHAVVSGCGFDRAGIFLYDAPARMMRGTWGTDTLGREEDIRKQDFAITDT